ncbi:MAG: ImmA/IrrE family metallo-endopeptidase [Pseudohongiellaceae bacterium]
MNSESIADSAYRLNREIWKYRQTLWNGNPPENPLEMLDQAIAAYVLGLQYEEADSLGRFGNGRERFEVAGLLERNDRIVRVSTRFSEVEQRFTAAHEFGHFELHPQAVAHRDRPLSGLSSKPRSRPRIEAEADYFSACFWMPPNLLKSQFEARFTTSPLPINDAVAIHLCPADPGSLLGTNAAKEITMTLANCQRFNGVAFPSLARTFRVSPSSMAIRLEELGLVA